MEEFFGRYEVCKLHLKNALIHTIQRKYRDLNSVEHLDTTDLWRLVDSIVACVGNANRQVSDQAVRMLGELPQLASGAAVKLHDEQIDPIVDALLRNLDHDEQVKATSQALGSYGSFRGPRIANGLLQILTANRGLGPSAMAAVLRALRGCGVDAASQAIRQIALLLQSQNAEVAIEAAKTLEYVGIDAVSVLSDVLDLFKQSDVLSTPSELVEHAARALVAIDPEGKQVLRSNLKYARRQQILQHLRNLGQTDIEDAARKLRRNLESEWGTVVAQSKKVKLFHLEDEPNALVDGIPDHLKKGEYKAVKALLEARGHRLHVTQLRQVAGSNGPNNVRSLRDRTPWDRVIRTPGEDKSDGYQVID